MSTRGLRCFPPVAAIAACSLLLAALASAAPNAMPTRTGDVALDGSLATMNALDAAGRAALVDDIVERFGAPRYLVREMLGARHWQAGDAYLACALAYHLRLPCSEVALDMEQAPGRGWSEIARDAGVRPGSETFRALKREARESAERVQPKSEPGDDAAQSAQAQGETPRK